MDGLNRRQAIEAVQSLLKVRSYEAERLDGLAAVVRPSTNWAVQQAQYRGRITWENCTQVPVPSDATENMARLAVRSETNFLPLVLDTFSQALKVDNYLSGKSGEDAERGTGGAWEWWQRNQMDARQTGLHRSALHYGVSYQTILPAMTPGQDRSATPSVYMYPCSPREMTAVYGERMLWDPSSGGPVDDDWPIMALEVKGPIIRLYDESMVHFIGTKAQPTSSFGWADPVFLRVSNFEYIEGRTHGVGVCPVVRYRDRVLLDGEEQHGIIEPLLTIQARINETTWGMLVAQYYAAFKQRYVIGWVPNSEAEGLKMKVNDTWTFKDPKDVVSVGQFEETDLTRYIESKKSGVMDLSAIGQLPPHAFGVTDISNISEATLAALETAKERKSDEIRTSLGESHEQSLRLAAFINGDSAGAEDFASEVKWQDLTAREFAAQVDGLGKLGQMLGVPDEILWEDIPGWTRSKVERALRLRELEPPEDEPPAEPPEPVGV